MFGAVWAQAELRKTLGAAGARVVDLELPVPSAEDAFTEDGALAERDQEEQLRNILLELRDSAERHLAARAVTS
jgi:chromate reductase